TGIPPRRVPAGRASPPSRNSASGRILVSSAATPRRSAGALCLSGFRYSGPVARTPRGTCSATGALTHRAMAGSACKPLTWPPRGRWSRTVPGSREAWAFGPVDFFQRNQTLTSPPESNRISPPMTDPSPRAGARTVTVPEDRDGQRLDNFLLGQLKGAPRSLVYKLVRSGQVRVNGGRAKAERKLAGGDEVRIPPVRVETEAERGTPAPGLLQRMEASIVFEDARILVIDKPSGVASHGGSGISFGAIETLRALRPGQTLELAHRLDRDTSGILVVAKKRSALAELQALMREGGSGGGIRKRYLTLLAGRMPDGTMSVDAPLHV